MFTPPCSSADIGTEREYKLSEDGELFQDLFAVMDWEDHRDTDPVCLKTLVSFTDHYVSKVIGSREVDRFHKNNRDKTLLDKLTINDYAYATLVYENSVAVWKDQHWKKRGGRGGDGEGGDEDGGNSVSQKYHYAKGTRLRTFACGWTPDGVAYMKELEEKFKALWDEKTFVDKFKLEWGNYVTEHEKYQFRGRGLSAVGGDTGVDNGDTSAFLLLDFPVPGQEHVDIQDEDPLEE